MTDYAWWQSHDNILILISYMADTGATTQEIVYAVEKPWKFELEWAYARELSNDG